MRLFYPDPDLADDVVTLRPWRLSDADVARRAAGDRHVSGDTRVEIVAPGEAHLLVRRKRDRLAHGEGVALALACAPDDDPVGQIWIGARPQPGVVGLGYWVLPESRGRGLARRAVRLAVDWALGPLGAERVEAWVRPDNEPSLRTLAATGFQREGVLRSFLAFDGERSDMVVWSRLATDS